MDLSDELDSQLNLVTISGAVLLTWLRYHGPWDRVFKPSGKGWTSSGWCCERFRADTSQGWSLPTRRKIRETSPGKRVVSRAWSWGSHQWMGSGMPSHRPPAVPLFPAQLLGVTLVT